MTFLEAAEEVLKRERKALHYKEMTDRAMRWSLLTFVGRTPEVTMQTQLTTAVKKAPGMPFVRVKPGVFGLLRYPDRPPEPEPEAPVAEPREGGRDRPGREAPAGTVAGAAARAAEPDSHGDEIQHDDDAGEGGPAFGGAPETGAARNQAAGGGVATGNGESGGVPDGGASEQGAFSGGLAGAGGGRRRRRRRRRRGGGGDAMSMSGSEPMSMSGVEQMSEAHEGETDAGEFEDAGRAEDGDAAALPGTEPGADEATARGPEGGDEAAPAADGQPPGAGRRIMAPIDAAIEVLRSQSPGRGIHVRQIADAAVRRRLVHGEPNEAWRVLRAALACESRERLRQGLRPRVRAAGSGLYALARRPSDMDLDRAEQVFGDARKALRERTLASLERRLTELTPAAFEALARVLLQKEGFGPATFVKRVEGTIYLEALRGRGSRPSRCLMALRAGAAVAGRRAIGELRAGIRARNQDEGLLLSPARLGDDAIGEWKQPGPPVEVIDGAALAEACARHGIGVVHATVSVDLLDTEFFADISER